MAKIKGAVRTGLIPITDAELDSAGAILVNGDASIPAVDYVDSFGESVAEMKTKIYNRRNRSATEVDPVALLFGVKGAKADWDPIDIRDVVGIVSQPSGQVAPFRFVNEANSEILSVELVGYNTKYYFVFICACVGGCPMDGMFKAYRSTSVIVTNSHIHAGDDTKS